MPDLLNLAFKLLIFTTPFTMRTATFFISLLLLFVSCKKDIAPGTPGCIKNEINANKNDPGWEVGSVNEYSFQGNLVYAFAPDGDIIADGSTAIKDASCNTICSIGGFGGPAVNECNGTNFYAVAVFKRNIWTK
jgi:hypothetical protein